MRAAALLLALLLAAPAWGQVTGQVVAAVPAWVERPSGDRLIVTTYTIRTATGDVTVRYEGGQIGDVSLHVSHTPSYRVGERVVQGDGGTWISRDAPEADFAGYGSVWRTMPFRYYVVPANLDGLPEPAVLAEIQRAVESWVGQSHANISVRYMGVGIARASYDYQNNVFFANEASGGTIAVTYWWGDGQGGLADTDIKYYDQSFKFYLASAGGCTGSMAEYVLDPGVHEFGHAFGLTHSTDTKATMYPTAHYCDTTWRSLAPDDIAGIESLYPPVGGTAPSVPSHVTVQS